MDEFELILAALAIFFLPFSYSYWLARKIKSVYLRLLPFYVSLIPIGFAVVTMMQPAGGFLDLRGVVALFCLIIAVLIILGMGAGTLLRRYHNKRANKKSEID